MKNKIESLPSGYETYQDKIPVGRVKPVGYFKGDLGFEC